MNPLKEMFSHVLGNRQSCSSIDLDRGQTLFFSMALWPDVKVCLPFAVFQSSKDYELENTSIFQEGFSFTLPIVYISLASAYFSLLHEELISLLPSKFKLKNN